MKKLILTLTLVVTSMSAFADFTLTTSCGKEYIIETEGKSMAEVMDEVNKFEAKCTETEDKGEQSENPDNPDKP